VITAITNSQPRSGEDQLGAIVVGGAFRIIPDVGALRAK
jgi:hypothetical protein